MNAMSKTPHDIRCALHQFNGSDYFTKWSPLFPKAVLTEGARYLSEAADAYWLMDAIASWQSDRKVHAQDFQVWILRQQADQSWTLLCEDGNYNVVAKQEIEFSDFPLSEGITLWAIHNELAGITIMLPSEY